MQEIIDVRSDTVTKPSKEMLAAMFNAEIGDDVFEEDPTVKKLEEKSAALFGKEAGLFCVSGTLSNQLALKIMTEPMQEMICDKASHIYNHEGGGYAFNSGISVRVIEGDRGRISAQDVLNNVNADFVHVPATSLVTLENTSNKGGGSCYALKDIQEIADVCRNNHLKLHLDGSRIFNALTKTNDKPDEIGKWFDTISFCLSKGLGAPMGSMLLSTKEKIKQARRFRKVWGGGMRQAGYLAAAGIYALDNNLTRLKYDHERASVIEQTLSTLSYVDQVLPVETNIILFKINKDVKNFLDYLAAKNIKAFPLGGKTIRIVTHLDFNDEMLEKVCAALKAF